MAGNLATKQEYKAGCDFRRFNGEFQQHIVGWGFYINNKNTVASQNSSGSENLTDPKMVLTPLTTLTTAPQGAETLVLSGFQGGGGGNPVKPAPRLHFRVHEVYSYTGKPLKADEVRSYTLEYWLMPACHPATGCEQDKQKISALRDLFVKGTKLLRH